jgi:predicted transposase/invertase (TIGR01784 family)
MKSYEESLKVYRDNKNTMDYAIQTAQKEAREDERLEMARSMKKEGLPPERIARITGLTDEQIALL